MEMYMGATCPGTRPAQLKRRPQFGDRRSYYYCASTKLGRKAKKIQTIYEMGMGIRKLATTPAKCLEGLKMKLATAPLINCRIEK